MKTYLATAPSNIAFIKYWGKQDPRQQWPTNDSLSMSLNNCLTETRICDAPRNEFVFKGQPLDSKTQSAKKVWDHIQLMQKDLDFEHNTIKIQSNNLFPSDCGIASSASGFAALTIAYLGYATNASSYEEILETIGLKKISDLCRMGSGSACRSVVGGFCQWSKNESPQTQSISSLDSSWQLL